MKKYETLYAKDSLGRLKQWDIQVDELEDGTSLISTFAGLETGKKAENGKIVKTGKNLGKKNETTAFEQACLEAQAKWQKKVDEGYLTDREEAENNTVVLPMLAHPFQKRGKDIKYPAFVQAKLDGIRCIASFKKGEVVLTSRTGKPIPHMEHIREALHRVYSPMEKKNLYFDGELYTQEIPFEIIVGAVRKEKTERSDFKTEAEYEEHHKNMRLVEYHIYDCFDLDRPEWTFEERHSWLTSLLVSLKRIPTPAFDCLKRVDTVEIDNETLLKGLHDNYVDFGYEGAMIRNKDGIYKLDSRSVDLQKYKAFFDAEYKITGFTQENSVNSEGAIIFICETDDGKQFNVRPRGSWELRRQWYDEGDKFIGKDLTVRYQELSAYNVPRFPVGIAVREDY